jgi:hypothetical protein
MGTNVKNLINGWLVSNSHIPVFLRRHKLLKDELFYKQENKQKLQPRCEKRNIMSTKDSPIYA